MDIDRRIEREREQALLYSRAVCWYYLRYRRRRAVLVSLAVLCAIGILLCLVFSWEGAFPWLLVVLIVALLGMGNRLPRDFRSLSCGLFRYVKILESIAKTEDEQVRVGHFFSVRRHYMLEMVEGRSVALKKLPRGLLEELRKGIAGSEGAEDR